MKHIPRLPVFLLLFLFFLPNAEAETGDTVLIVIDTLKSRVDWKCDKHYGFVPLKSGTIKLVDGNIAGGSFVMNMDSLKDSDITYDLMRKTLHNTLRSQFFFDTEKYPVSEFYIDYAEPEGNDRFRITGDLIIKGIDNCISFDAKIIRRKPYFKAVTDTFFIDRTQWGITIYSKEEAEDENSVIVSDEIYFVIHLTGKAKQE